MFSSDVWKILEKPEKKARVRRRRHYTTQGSTTAELGVALGKVRHMEASSLGFDAHNWGEKGKKKPFQTYMLAGDFFQNSTKMRRMDFINQPTSAELVWNL